MFKNRLWSGALVAALLCATAADAETGLAVRVTGGPLSPSAVAPVTGALSATGQSASFTPDAGRPFNVQLSGTFAATCQLERQINSLWSPLTVSAGGSAVQVEVWSAPASDSWVEYQWGTPYRINCTSYTSGTVNISLSQ